MADDALIAAFRANPGGVGNFLPPDKKQAIRDGQKNRPENTSPYDVKKLLEGADVAIKNHPLEWLER